jgi:phage terminase Nu1 subunit (DNA packaging protein)
VVNQRKEFKEHEVLTQEQVRLVKARADKLEIEIGETTKNLVPIKTVEKVWGEVISATKKRLLSLPQAMAPELSLMGNPAEIEDFIATRLTECLQELSRGAHF